MNKEFSIRAALKEEEHIQENPELLDILLAIFDFTQYLLDDDDNLTKTGNLNSKAREKLDSRIIELYLGED